MAPPLSVPAILKHFVGPVAPSVPTTSSKSWTEVFISFVSSSIVVKRAFAVGDILYKAPLASTLIWVLSPDVPTKDAKVSCLITAETPIKY